jgi:hypothetical protein
MGFMLLASICGYSVAGIQKQRGLVQFESWVRDIVAEGKQCAVPAGWLMPG